MNETVFIFKLVTGEEILAEYVGREEQISGSSVKLKAPLVFDGVRFSSWIHGLGPKYTMMLSENIIVVDSKFILKWFLASTELALDYEAAVETFQHVAEDLHGITDEDRGIGGYEL